VFFKSEEMPDVGGGEGVLDTGLQPGALEKLQANKYYKLEQNKFKVEFQITLNYTTVTHGRGEILNLRVISSKYCYIQICAKIKLNLNSR
jgi:hypothetical protein